MNFSPNHLDKRLVTFCSFGGLFGEVARRDVDEVELFENLASRVAFVEKVVEILLELKIALGLLLDFGNGLLLVNPLNLQLLLLQRRNNRRNQQHDVPLEDVLLKIKAVEEVEVGSQLNAHEVPPGQLLEVVPVYHLGLG